jgi:glycosyltransferase involved in cell wall biosynthesis
MNILIVSAMFPPIRTGTSFYAYNLARMLAMRGDGVLVVTTTNSERNSDAEYPFPVERLPCLHISLRSMFKHLRFSSFHIANYARMRRLASDLGADAILLVNHYLDIAFPAIFTSRSLGIPLIVSVGTQIQSTQRWKDSILRILDRVICGGLVFPSCARIIAWDSEIGRYLADVQGKSILRKVDLVPYGVNGDPSAIASVEHDYGLDDQILGVGAVIEQRNFIVLIKALHRLRPRYPRLKLKIIGHVYFDAPVRLAKSLGLGDAVIFTGEMPHSVVLEEMGKSVLYWGGLSSGRYSGLGTATIEAMLSGLPVFANIPETLLGADALRDGEHFVFTDGEDIGNIAARIEGLLSDEALRRTIGSKARRFVLEKMNWDRIGGMIEDLVVVERDRRGTHAE